MITEVEEKESQRLLWVGLLLFALVIVDAIANSYSTTTQISPPHEGADNFCLLLSCAAAVACGVTSYFLGKHIALWRRVGFSVAMMFLGFLAVFLLSTDVADTIQQQQDFPPNSTHTFTDNLKIDRAYRTNGKGRSWNIQTTPIWSNLEITSTDYQFMLDHRSPLDTGADPEEITSQGYFCAHVTMQQAGQALRVLHAGSGKLPEGTVIVCPGNTGIAVAP